MNYWKQGANEVLKEKKGSNILSNREKLYTDEVIAMYPDGVWLDEVEIITSKKTGDEYAVCGIKDTDTYFNAGKILSEIVREWIKGLGSVEAVNAKLKESGGALVKLSKATSRAGRVYTRVEVL